MNRGFTDILLVALLALGGIGYAVWSRTRTSIPSRHRADVEQTMAETEARLGMAWKGKPLRLKTVLPDRRVHGRWAVERGELCLAGWTWAGQTIVIVTDPEGNIPEVGARSALAHEIAHQILLRHGVPIEQHHDRMRQAGVGVW